MSADDVLFSRYDWSQAIEGQKAALVKAIQSLTKDRLLGESSEELIDELAEQFSINVPELDEGNITVSQKEVDIELGNDPFGFGDRRTARGTEVTVKIPFTGDAELFNVRPNKWSTMLPRGEVYHGQILLHIRGRSLTPESLRKEIDGELASVNQYLEWQRESLGDFPTTLRQIINSEVARRKEKLQADNDLISGLGFKTE